MRTNGRRAFTAALAVALLLLVIPAWAVTAPVATTDITLTPSGSVKLTVGEASTVEAAVIPANSTQPVAWRSSDPKVATVEGGVVKAVGKGAATVTAVSGDREATLEVRVVPQTVETTGITLAPAGTVRLKVGEKETLKATLEPWNSTQLVKWVSSDTAVATVRRGVVKAVGEGTAVITAKSGGMKARVKVKVSAP